MIKFNYSTKADLKHNSFSEDFLTTMLSKFETITNNPDLGFFHLTDHYELIASTQAIFDKHKNKKHFVQIGIGGSALGPQMLISALQKDHSRTFTFLDNTDPDYIYDELQKIDIKESLFYVVSKSGGTAETIACYALLRNKLLALGVSESQLGQYFVFCTDPTSGQLREHVDRHGYDALIVPSNIGGRFSVLTPVGLLPAIFAGIDIKALFDGANEFKKEILDKNISSNNLIQSAAHLAYLYKESDPKVNETVLMPYSSKLKDLSFWFVQLWAESLGKWSEATKSHQGFTPIPAYGATDQHSQVQLFMEGPHNKCMFMLNIEKSEHDFNLESALDFDSAKKLNPYTMSQLIEAEFNGTLKALEENQRDYIQMTIPRLNEASIASLVLFFECLTALMGEYLQVDPFDQPGVELGKVYTYEYLNNLTR